MSALGVDQFIEAGTALVGVLGLILVAGWALRFVRREAAGRSPGRLRVAESVLLDARHRLVRIVDGDREHLLVLGPAGTVRIDGRTHGAASAGESA